jgi:tetratricopeptide (TPR) repeat protein
MRWLSLSLFTLNNGVSLGVKITNALLVALCLFFWPPSFAKSEPGALELANALNDEWEEIFYTLPANRQAERFKELLPRVRELQAKYPNRAEPLIIEAVTLCTLAAAEWSFSALTDIEKARDLLTKSVELDPKAMEAAAFIALGNLYYRLPGWPISFGDDDLARQYLETAVRIYPDEVDTNYFLGDYWLSEDEYEKALPYLEKADKAAVRPYHSLSDKHTKEETRKALEAARKHESGRDSFFSDIMPSFLKQQPE